MIRSILVPLDGSPFAEHALPLAAAVARRTGATLHLAHVHQVPSPPEFFSPELADLHVRQDEQTYLADVSRRLETDVPLARKTVLLFGEVPDALRRYAQREAVELVVMATHARGTVRRFWLGSVTDDLAAALTQPVLLVRPGEGKPDFDRAADLHSVVVPLDGSASAERALESAVEMARCFDAELALVRVAPPAVVPDFLPEGGILVGGVSDEAEAAQRRECAEAKQYLDGVAARLAERGVRTRTDVVVRGSAAEGILAEADARHAGLIALETHARRGLSRVLFGSVAEDVVRGGEVPVLLHH